MFEIAETMLECVIKRAIPPSLLVGCQYQKPLSVANVIDTQMVAVHEAEAPGLVKIDRSNIFICHHAHIQTKSKYHRSQWEWIT
jgi:hypothetical protein